jgi:hypothetical protein
MAGVVRRPTLPRWRYSIFYAKIDEFKRPMLTSSLGPLRNIGPAARWCLSAGIVNSPLPTPEPEAFWNERDRILQEGLAAVAFRAFEPQANPRENPVANIFYAAAMNSHIRCMAADRAAAVFLPVLSRAGIPVAIIKGPALASLHPEGWTRPYGDIDIVVSGQSFHSAVELARGCGFDSPRSPPQWDWFYVICREGVNLHSGDGGNIDIHHHLPPWVLGSSVHVEDVIERSVPSRLCGVSVNFGSTEDHLLITALHVLNDLWKGKLGLASWRDIIVLMTSLGMDDSQKVFERAGLGWLFDLVTAALSAVVPETGIVPSSSPSRMGLRTRIRVAALGWEKDSVLARHRLTWAMRLPVPNALAFLGGSAFPERKFIRERHESLWKYWKGGWDETTSTIRGSDYRMTRVEDKRHDNSPI